MDFAASQKISGACVKVVMPVKKYRLYLKTSLI